MSRLSANEEHLPSLVSIEKAAERLSREADRIVTAARDEHERLAASEATGRGEGARYVAAHRLRRLARLLDRAQSSLVLPDDERFRAAQQILEWLDKQDASDAPWAAAA